MGARLEPPLRSSTARQRLNRGAVELFTTREEAEAIVQAWDRGEPDQQAEMLIREGLVDVA